MIFYYVVKLDRWSPRKAMDRPMHDPKERRKFRSEFHEIKADEEGLSLDILSRLYPAPPKP